VYHAIHHSEPKVDVIMSESVQEMRLKLQCLSLCLTNAFE